MVGDAPTLESSSSIKGCAANNFGHSVPRVRTYWPRISRQFDRSTGLSAPSSDTFPEWLSFRNRRQCELAVGIERGQFKLDYEGLAASLGVSVKIVSQVSRRPARHYRSFSIQKKSGGERKISSPRVFLKVMQWFLDDFILDGLPVHSSVHSFVTGKSVATNGKLHVCQSYVGSIDIENYFGSITKAMVQRLLLENGFLDDEVSLISALTTLNDTLPQGAPTSATLSNAILYGFDCDMAMSCEEAGLVYSRYADDITISGSSREAVERALSRAKRQLANRSFRTNPSKTRIVSDRARQVVTGVVVNAVAQPSRTYRRNVRAKFHNAAKQKTPAGVEIRALAGHLAYLKMFSSLTGSRQIAALERDLRKVRAKKQE
ncbi:MAG: RNA-directed DNA polymerase [Caulobacterales bacterium]|nr:RNA-directed DNA polymerase [Caulobacterales bacterium]